MVKIPTYNLKVLLPKKIWRGYCLCRLCGTDRTARRTAWVTGITIVLFPNEYEA